MDLSGAQLTWRGLTLEGGDEPAPLTFSSISGWESTPPVERRATRKRPNSHGAFPNRVLATERQVLVTGLCATPEQRDDLLMQLQASLHLADDGYGVDDLTVTLAGRTLSARAQLIGFEPEVAGLWGPGMFPWLAEWVCSDPFRYGTPERESTGLPQDLGGLRSDLFTDGAGNPVDYLDFGPLGTTGRVTVTNPGTAEARSLLEVTGSMPLGFELIETRTGRRLRYEEPVTASSTVTLDSATGRVRLDTADRGGALTRAEWWGVPARDPRGVPGQREVLFQSLSGYAADARLTVTTYPTYW